MASGDVYELIDVQEKSGQEFQNVYFYEQDGAFIPASGNTATSLGEAWVDGVLPAILGTQSAAVLHTEVRVRNLFNPVDAGDVISGLNGTMPKTSQGEMPLFNAWGLTLVQDNASIRDGAKRIGGILELAQEDGVPTPDAITALNAAADAIAAPIPAGTIFMDDLMFPVVVKRVKEGDGPTAEYSLPTNILQKVVGTITEVLISMLVTSQTSRKIGVGI